MDFGTKIIFFLKKAYKETFSTQSRAITVICSFIVKSFVKSRFERFFFKPDYNRASLMKPGDFRDANLLPNDVVKICFVFER